MGESLENQFRKIAPHSFYSGFKHSVVLEDTILCYPTGKVLHDDRYLTINFDLLLTLFSIIIYRNKILRGVKPSSHDVFRTEIISVLYLF